MVSDVTNKADMYKRLCAGEFGNTTSQYFSLGDWEASKEYPRYEYWGIRSATTAGHPKTKMYVHRDDVRDYVLLHFLTGVNISVMVDSVRRVTAFCNAIRTENGLLVEAVLDPERGVSWRKAMLSPVSFYRTDAVTLLRSILNANSYDDVSDLLDRYPDHVVEFSALDSCFGLIPHRNHIVWEVRKY